MKKNFSKTYQISTQPIVLHPTQPVLDCQVDEEERQYQEWKRANGLTKTDWCRTTSRFIS